MLGRLPNLRHVNVHGTGCAPEALAQMAAGAGDSPLRAAQVVPPWVLGRL